MANAADNETLRYINVYHSLGEILQGVGRGFIGIWVDEFSPCHQPHPAHISSTSNSTSTSTFLTEHNYLTDL